MESDDPPRVKFLCSFGGSILPRPVDGRLRYVGGETRILTAPRDVSYADLLARMRDLLDGVTSIKYQQPDEDLDALVSVVNDDDVTNMMEEYDKLVAASGDGFTRLRIFLFSPQHPELDHSAVAVSQFDVADERETERRYVDALNTLVDAKSLAFPSSPPSSTRHHPFEFGDRVSDEYFRPSPSHYDPQSAQYTDNSMWLPPGAVVQEKAGFPGTLSHAHGAFDGCEHCRMAFQRTQDPRYADPRWSHGQHHMEQSNTVSDHPYRDREAYMMDRPFYNEGHGPDRGWGLHHPQAGHRIADPRVHPSGGGRLGEHYLVDDNAMNAPFAPTNFYEGHDDTRFLRPGAEFGNEFIHPQQTVGSGSHAHAPGFEDPAVRYGNRGSVYGIDNLYQVQQNLPPIQLMRRKAQIPLHPGTSYDSPGTVTPNGGINSGYIRSPQDGSPRLARVGNDDQIPNSWIGPQNGGTSQRTFGLDGPAAPEYLYGHGPRMGQHIDGPAGWFSIVPDPSQHRPGKLHVEAPSESVPPAPVLVDVKLSAVDDHMAPSEEKSPAVQLYEANEQPIPSSNEKQPFNSGGNELKLTEKERQVAIVDNSEAKSAEEHKGVSVGSLSFLPELIASVKKAAVENAEVIKAKAEADTDEIPSVSEKKKSSLHEYDPEVKENVCTDLEAEAKVDDEDIKISKIEPTTAEAEALAKGLQTIRNDDLEEIKQLGTGSYGSVYHGKWRGSDVAVKRIKASCFAGRPSDRERLIADFWKEALILSSLHHPNVVSFYGVVRDGPDGSLATVTEFMVNGSLKQFLQKKDRTVDRRKRLILAMDTAFGMEYLHGKNIVHFDLKCENLLVNMRDPHRPVCKIGDLGLSKVKQHTLVSGGVRGTLPWMAPELLTGKSYMVTEKIDVYSFGIVMWELLTGDDPYTDMRCASLIGGIVNNTLRPQIPTWCDPEWKSLMESCWSYDPGERPSFFEISQKLRKMAAAINVK